jgi:HD-like signal output (HDOD) protein
LKSTESIITDLSLLITDRLGIGGSTKIATANFEALFLRDNASSMASTNKILDGQVNLPTSCQLLSDTENCDTKILRKKVIQIQINSILFF